MKELAFGLNFEKYGESQSKNGNIVMDETSNVRRV